MSFAVLPPAYFGILPWLYPCLYVFHHYSSAFGSSTAANKTSGNHRIPNIV